MKNNTTRAAELLALLRSRNYTNSQFWEAQDLLNSIPERAWTDVHVRLQAAWCDEEERRIESGTHRGPDEELHIQARNFWA